MGCVFTTEKKKEMENSENTKIKKPDLQLEIRLERYGIFQSNVSSRSEISKNNE